MLMAAAGAQGERIRLLAVRDVEDDTAWARALRRGAGCKQGEAPPRLAGFEGDEDFQRRCELLGWDPLPVAPHPGPSEASLRDVLLGGAADQALLTVLRPYLSRPVLEYLRAWLALPYHRELCAEWQALQSIREELANATQPRLQVGVEALVHSEDQVLMLRRGEAPGLGLWALPGALLGHDERLLEASLRALRRQTGIGMLQISLQDALREVRVFDRPHRLPQARLISHVHRFALGDHLPQARGGEGALSVAWLPISALPGMQASIFADHFAILDHFFGLGDPLQVPVDGQG